MSGLGNVTQTGRRSVDDKGTMIWVKNTIGSTQSAGAVLRLNGAITEGMVVAAILHSTTNTQKLVILKNDIADDEFGWAYVEGQNITATVPSATYTAGNSLRIDDSDDGIVDGGAAFDFDNATDFAEVNVGGATVTSVTVNLYDREVVSQA